MGFTVQRAAGLGSFRRQMLGDFRTRLGVLKAAPSGPIGDVLIAAPSHGELQEPRVGQIVTHHGVDALRMAMAFAAPPAQPFVWSDYSTRAAATWLSRFCRLVDGAEDCGQAGLYAAAHSTLQACEAELADRFAVNRFVGRIMGLVQSIADAEAIDARALDMAVAMAYPVIPETCMELWRSRHDGIPAWPLLDRHALAPSTIELAVQVNGRVRGRVQAAPNVPREAALRLASRVGNVARHLSGKTVDRVFYVPDKLINFVVS